MGLRHLSEDSTGGQARVQAGQGRSIVHPKYRPDIDGLRAIAVLSVVGFHAFPAWIKGGFIGVDLFFVISGFLITTIILGSFEGEGFSYRTFYARRIRRIFPALVLVMAVTLAAGWYLLLPDEWAQLGRHLAGGAGFVSNFVFWHEAGYFDTASETKLLLHLWSLSIEEQFYIVWPLLLGLALWRKWPVLPVLAVIALVSFLINVGLVTTGHASAAFYAPPARAWELMAGGMLACLRLHTFKPWLPWSPALRSHVQSIAGVALIVLGLVFIRDGQAFPGWWALLPVLGAVLCIAAGPGGWLNRVLLAWRPMVWVGLISYPLYLWHWPLLAFARLLANDIPSRNVRIGVVIAAFALAWLTYRFVEKKLRRGRGARPIVILCAAMVALGLAGALVVSGRWSARLNDPQLSAQLSVIMKAPKDWDYPGTMERYTLNGQTAYRMGHGAHKVLLIGDSHIEQTAPRLQALLDHNPQQPVSFHFLTASSCPPIRHIVPIKVPTCVAAHDAMWAAARDGGFDTVVFGGIWNYYFHLSSVESSLGVYYADGADRLWTDSAKGTHAALHMLEQELAELTAQHKKVYLLLDNPRAEFLSPKYLLKGDRWGRLSVDSFASTMPWPTDQARLHERMRELALRAGAQVIDPIPTLCPNGQCIRSMVDGRPVYKDSDHLSASYTREYARYLDVLAQPPHEPH
ncbi:MAG: acyltransferase [Burkholderiaceae bacterium]|nr:acyltransferase [Burkholderiaceae bacterium]